MEAGLREGHSAHLSSYRCKKASGIVLTMPYLCWSSWADRRVVIDYVAVALTLAGMIGFFNAAEFEAREGAPNHRVLWGALSLLISVLVLFVGGFGWLPWLLAQTGLFVGIAAVRVWLEARRS